MKRFIKKIFLFSLISILLITLFVLFDFCIVGNQYSHNYQASLIDKMNRLKSIDGPKIVLVGNSNVAFGFDSKMIEEEFGYPVVNLGLHGAMGNAFHENMIKGNISNGDIVILCHTNYSDDGRLEDAGLAWITIEKNKELYSLIDKNDYGAMIKAYPRYATKCFGMWIKKSGNEMIDGCYSREAFNEYGDICYRPDFDINTTLDQFKDGINPPQINDACINRINRLDAYVKAQGATLLIAGYPIGDGEYTASQEEFLNFQNELKSKLECDVISDFRNYFIPYKYFYNSNMHLTHEGAQIRTKQLIEDLRNWEREGGDSDK